MTYIYIFINEVTEIIFHNYSWIKSNKKNMKNKTFIIFLYLLLVAGSLLSIGNLYGTVRETVPGIDFFILAVCGFASMLLGEKEN